jgi:hypothetical protein
MSTLMKEGKITTETEVWSADGQLLNDNEAKGGWEGGWERIKNKPALMSRLLEKKGDDGLASAVAFATGLVTEQLTKTQTKQASDAAFAKVSIVGVDGFMIDLK